MDDRVARLLDKRHEFLAFLTRKVGDRALAEDLLQDAFARVDKLAQLRDDESAVAWFYRVLRNAVIDRARREQAKSRALESFAHELAQEPPRETEGAICQCIAALKDELPASYREALERVELEHVAVKDYAQEAGISANNAAVRIFRARNALREQVAKACGACATHGCLDCNCKPHSG
ncbi:MAG TPA: sigma-70 family RNA polymerase sigma factor [Polyangiales bacterium]